MREKIISIGFLITLMFFGLYGLFLPDEKISFSERRVLSEFPKFQVDALFSGDYFENVNTYLVEHFPMRESFRKMKGYVAKTIFQKKEENNIFTYQNKIYELNTRLNEKSVNHLTDLIQDITKKYFQDNKVYYGIIPDKNYYLNTNIPKLDYLKLEEMFQKNLTELPYISLFHSLTLEDYYNTDIHWRQEKLEKVRNTLVSTMHLEENTFPKEKQTYSNFYGALYGRIAHNINPDNLIYVTNSIINAAKVYDYEKKENTLVYEKSNLSNIDSYDVFLGGAKPLLFIQNEHAKTKKRLILFRDSFGSSLAPLLIDNYSEIILIDLRYISSKCLDSIEELNLKNTNQDVLFLYSVPIINNSFTLK